jgi:hypothetical protein
LRLINPDHLIDRRSGPPKIYLHDEDDLEICVHEFTTELRLPEFPLPLTTGLKTPPISG